MLFVCLLHFQEGKSSAASESVGLPGVPFKAKPTVIKEEHPGLPLLLAEWKIHATGQVKIAKTMTEMRQFKGSPFSDRT